MWEHSVPKAGKKIVALYVDGSGGTLFAVVDDGHGGILLIDSDGDQSDVENLLYSGTYSLWAYLPKDTKLWCELRADEPLNFGN